MEIFKKMGKVWKLSIAALLLLAPSSYAQQIHLVTNAVNNPDGSQTLPHHVPRAVTLSSTKRMALANANQMLDLRMILPSRDQAGLDSLVQGLYNPKSPNYHKFLTHKQVIQQFGADPVDSALVIGQLKSYGLTVKSQSDDGCILRVTGPVSAVERMFKLNIYNYKLSNGTLFFAPDSNPTIPTPIAGKINAIAGMDNVHKYYPHHHLKKYTGVVKPQVSNSTVNTLTLKAASPATKMALPAFSGPDGTVAPSDLLTAYNLNSVPSTGSTQTQALFELDEYKASDITEFLNYFSLTYNLANISVICIDSTCPPLGEGVGEDDLDIDLTIALAPGISKIRVYEADQDTDANAWLDEWTQIYDDYGTPSTAAQVVSCSWGAQEDGPDVAHTIFEEMTAQGQTIFAASGDSGAYDNCQGGTLPPDCEDIYGDPITGELSVDDPASDPYVTGVGISILSVNGSEAYTGETSSAQGGGGISSVWSIPSFQQGLTLAGGSKVSTSMRNVPDVVLTADPATQYWIYISDPEEGTGWYTVWGSSASSPLWAAFISRVNQARVAASQSVIGYLNPVIYQIANGSNYNVDFHDITTGYNCDSSDLAQYPCYPGATGYDDASGLGSFNGAHLYSDLAGLSAPTGLTATPGNAQVTLSWTPTAGAVSYNINSSTTSGGETLLTNVLASSCSSSCGYVNTGLTNGQTYYYEVSAVNSLFQVGPNSSQVSATPIAPPSAPASLTATAGNTQVGLSWAASATATSYTVNRGTATGGPYSLVTTVTGLSYTDTGLTNGDPYYYVIQAVNAGGPSGNSPEANATPSASLPLAPTNVIALAGNTQVSLTWNASLTATSYNVKRATVTGGPYTTISTSGRVTGVSYIDSTVANGQIYYYVISAVNGTGEGANSTEVSATPIAVAGPSSLNASILAERVGKIIVEGGALLTWRQTTAPNVNQNKVYRSSGGGAYALLVTVAPSTTYTDKNLTKGTTYHYMVTAHFVNGSESLPSNSSTINY